MYADSTYCRQEGVTVLPFRCKDDEYYTVGEVAEIKGIRRQSVIEGCKRGQYPGAYKTIPDATNRQGIWLIPVSLFDTSTATQDVIVLTKQLTLDDLQVMIENGIEKAIDERMKKFEDRLETHDRLLIETLRAIQVKDQQKKKPFWKFW